MLNTNLLQINDSEKNGIYDALEVTDFKMQQSIDHLLAWYKLQPHLPKETPDESCLKTLLMCNKMSLEKCKSKLDMKYTLRGIFPEFFVYSSFFKNGFKKTMENSHWCTLPKLSNDLSRVTIMKLVGEPEEFNLADHFKRCYIIADYRMHGDLCLSDRFLLDFKNLKLGHLKKLNPLILKKSDIATTKAYGLRSSGIHIINAPPFVDSLIVILKQALSAKLSSRIKSYEKIEDLYADIPKEILPVEYGGDERSIDVLADEWYKEIMSNKCQNLFLKEEQLKADETKRLIPCNDEDILGIQGSFRKLDVD